MEETTTGIERTIYSRSKKQCNMEYGKSCYMHSYDNYFLFVVLAEIA